MDPTAKAILTDFCLRDSYKRRGVNYALQRSNLSDGNTEEYIMTGIIGEYDSNPSLPGVIDVCRKAGSLGYLLYIFRFENWSTYGYCFDRAQERIYRISKAKKMKHKWT